MTFCRGRASPPAAGRVRLVATGRSGSTPADIPGKLPAAGQQRALDRHFSLLRRCNDDPKRIRRPKRRRELPSRTPIACTPRQRNRLTIRSILPARPPPLRPDWAAAGLRYYRYNFFLRQKFGGRVQKVSVDAGFTCPNVDGTVAVGGCTFCDNRSFSPSRRLPRQSIREQIDEGIRRLKHRYKARPLPGLLSTGHEYLCSGRAAAERLRRGARRPSDSGFGDRHSPGLRCRRRAGLARRDRRPDLSLGRIWPANDSRSVAGVDEPRTRRGGVFRCHGSQPGTRFRNLCRM